MRKRRSLRAAIMIMAPLGLLCGSLMVLGVPESASAGTVTGTVTGMVFRDYNSSGVDYTTATAADPAVDVGVPGAVVTAFDSTDTQVGTATSASDGTYSLSISGAASDAIRLEFTPPTGFFSGPIATASVNSPIVSSGPEQFVTHPFASCASFWGSSVHGPPYLQYQPAKSKMDTTTTPTRTFSRQVGMARDNAR